jgi:hypothetical protein
MRCVGRKTENDNAMFLAFQWVQDVVIMKLGIYLCEIHEVVGAVAVMPVQHQ